jgi:tRNA-dihydrouridine synthase B
MLTIGNIMLPIPCILAPMAGVSDLPFRLINRTFGAPMAFTEMIDARALSHNDKRTLRMLSSTPDDRPLGVQLLGNSEEHILKAMDVLDGYEFDLIDFNAACPTTKITRNGKGAALLREPKKLKDILRLLVCRSKVPVTVKIRAGWDSNSINAREVALYAEDAGVSALFIHGRTKTQGYSGTVDYPVIKEVKEALKIPVIASGDGVSLSFIGKMFNETCCDGVAIARGALGNPWIFREVIRFFQNGTLCERPDINERIEIMKRHLNLLTQYYGEKKSVSCFHKFFIWYTRGLSGMKPLRDRAFRTGTRDELISAIEELRGFAGDLNEEL